METVDIESRCIYGEAKDAEPFGNAAAMREAAKATMKFIESAIVNGKVSVEALTTLQNIVSKALAAPPRNCDRQYQNAYDVLKYFTDETGRQIFNTADVIDWLLFAEAKGVNENA